MEVIHFTILIKADKKKVWHTMLDKNTYPFWTKEFGEGSDYEGNWAEGSEIRFVAPDKEGKVQGMFSKIKDNKEYKFMSIQHLGMITNGVVDTTSEEVRKWAPSLENYTFIDKGNQTELKVDMEVNEEYKSMFEEMWPRALKALKSLCEK